MAVGLLLVGVEVRAAGDEQRTALAAAAEAGDGATFMRLLEQKPYPVLDAVGRKDKRSALHLLAANNMHKEMAALLQKSDELVAKAAKMRAQGDDLPPDLAANARGVRLNRGSKHQFTPLHLAARSGHREAVGSLLSRGANPNAVDRYKNTPLHGAAEEGHPRVVRALASSGALSKGNRIERLPLHLAVKNRHLDVAQVLVAGAGRGVYDEARDKDGLTPLHYAAKRGDVDMTALLLRRQTPDAIDDDKATALHYAAENGHDKVVALLLNAGADANVTNADGETPTDLAKDEQIEALLEEHLSEELVPGEDGGALVKGTGETAATPEALRPNILFILTDDQRQDSLSCYGNPVIRTPVLDFLAGMGTRFENAFVTTPAGGASRASIFTGVTEATHGYTTGRDDGISPPHMSQSYPALLKANGYKTGFTGKLGVQLADQAALLATCFDVFKPYSRPFTSMQSDGRRRHVDELVEWEALRMMEQMRDGPFCISVSFASTHADDGSRAVGSGQFPYPAEVDNLYTDTVFPEPKNVESDYLKTLPAFLSGSDGSLNRYHYLSRWETPAKYQENMRAYARMTSAVDRIIGRMLLKLDALGLAKNTVVIYAADNGTFMGNRGMGGKWSHFDEAMRVPLIIFDPRVKSPRVATEMVLNLDLPATMLAIGGIRAPAHYQGGNLLPLLTGQGAALRDSFFCEHRMNTPRIAKWQGTRGQRYVYANYYEKNYEFLHDMQYDPGQVANLAENPKYREVLRRMRDLTRDKARLHSLP
jgi:arylsulfatase A-like enzyme/ankyrin repeat protein